MSGLEDKLINQTLLPNHALVYGRREGQDSQTVMIPGFLYQICFPGVMPRVFWVFFA